ncbi:MAG: OmpA family protein [Proteobacteria bacterium]|nr:OmpA family protein [Pseudomonadota bacterium]
MATKPGFRLSVLTLIILLGLNSAFAQDELRKTFFKDADIAKAAAEAADAGLLAPRSFADGMSSYTSAEDTLARGRNIETVRSHAADATQSFRTATTAAELARVKLAQVMKSRQDAANARAPELSPEIWNEAQRKFSDAIRLLERGDLKTASRREVEATALYRDAELVAIKAQYLSETRRLLADADRARVGRYAEITLTKAKQLLADAERELNENRYDTDLPRSLARQANYEAKHAIYLSVIVRRVRDKELTPEQLVLDWEANMRTVAGAADVQPDMEDGPERLTAELVSYIEGVREANQALQQETAENSARLAEMEEEMSALDERLGGATAERAALIQRLEAQARVKEQFDQVDKMFTQSEARVFREGNNIILRMVGLTFSSGDAQLGSQSFDLLAKVEKAIDVFPRSELIIEGHTDSFGGDDSNQKLSQQRAESVQQYMIDAMRIPTYRLIATGYGETRPIASNETESGRQHNRRIDIVIRPNLEQN